MRLKSHASAVIDIDMTPMIDIVFQLLSFFTFILNFEAAEQDERVILPASSLARPPEAPLEAPITIQLTRRGTVLAGGQEFANPAAVRPLLNNEKYVLESQNRVVSDATIIIRAHRDARTGDVQELIKTCQQVGFEKFTLRAKEDRE
jgi:biopolymer transport protein ExbD